MTIRVGFIGTGFIARTHNWFLKHTAADHRIVAVHDLDTERARRSPIESEPRGSARTNCSNGSTRCS